MSEKFVGIQISPLSFLDEGIEPLLDTLQGRFGINTLLIGTISWLGLKVGRRISHKLEGCPITAFTNSLKYPVMKFNRCWGAAPAEWFFGPSS